MSGFDYIITVRKPTDDKTAYTDSPGESDFIKVPDTRAYTPGDKIPRTDWINDVIGESAPHRDATGTDRGDVLVFIHGFNNTIDDILKRHRLLKRDLPQYGYNGAVVSFDWPCGDVALAYLDDRTRAKETAFRLVTDCIAPIVALQASGACSTNVHLLAHSTGAYVIREAFDDADDRPQVAMTNWTVSQIALISGDVSSASMSGGNSSAESIYRHCVRLTNYSNPYDEVLQLSNAKRVGVAPRVGRIGLPIDAPASAVNVICGVYYQALVATKPSSEIGAVFSHSWQFGDPIFTQDLAATLGGEIDRGVIATRARSADGGLQLVVPVA
jgi:esterase/lipase superfamily enzyme